MASLVFLSAEVRADWGKPEPSPFIHLVIQQIVPEGLPCTRLNARSWKSGSEQDWQGFCSHGGTGNR